MLNGGSFSRSTMNCWADMAELASAPAQRHRQLLRSPRAVAAARRTKPADIRHLAVAAAGRAGRLNRPPPMDKSDHGGQHHQARDSQHGAAPAVEVLPWVALLGVAVAVAAVLLWRALRCFGGPKVVETAEALEAADAEAQHEEPEEGGELGRSGGGGLAAHEERGVRRRVRKCPRLAAA